MASDNITEQAVSQFISTRAAIVFPDSALMFLFAVYGIYIVVFGLSIRVFTKQRDNRPPQLYLWGTISLFILDTIYVAFYTSGTIHQQITYFEALRTRDFDKISGYLSHDSLKTVAEAGVDFISDLMIILADSMLIHRCYIVWGSKRSILYPLITLSIIINGMLLGSQCVIIFVYSNSAIHGKFYPKAINVNDDISIAVVIFNSILTLMTVFSWLDTEVGRIWYITSEVEKVMGRSINSRYSKIIAIILTRPGISIESGVLFPATLLAATVASMLNSVKMSLVIPINVSFLSTQFSGLAPTMIIVQVAYNKPVESVQEMVSAIRFGNSEQQKSKSTSV